MKCALFLAATLLAAQLPGNALAVTVHSNLAITGDQTVAPLITKIGSIPLHGGGTSGSGTTNRTNGTCGSANGAAASTAPTANLCSAGTASSLIGSGPWSWYCAGSNGGATVACSDTLASTGGTSGDPTSGLLPSDRSAYANWKKAGLQSVGGIPNRTTICATVRPSGGDDTANIQAAINNCQLGQVVMLSAGTFTVKGPNFVKINKSITVRGSGPCASAYGKHNSGAYPATPSMTSCTLIQRSNGASVGVQGPGWSPHFVMGSDIYNIWVGTTSNLAADGAAGSYTVQVAKTTGFSVGNLALIDETSNFAWQPSWIWSGQKQWSSPDYLLGMRIQNPTCLAADHFCKGGSTPPTIPCWFSFTNSSGATECDRYTREIKLIVSIGSGPCPGTNCTITFDSPLTAPYRTSHTAHVAYLYQNPNGVPTAQVQYAGLENMTLQNADTGSVSMMLCAYCWVKGVESTVNSGGTINITAGFRDQIEMVYDHYGAWPVQGGAGYNWTLDNGSTEILIENSVSMLNDKVMVVRDSGAGSVIAYNYFDDGFDAVSGWAGAESGANATHWLGSHHVLFEGNWTFGADADNTWGPGPFITWLRNDVSGFRTKFTDYLYHFDIDDKNNNPGTSNGNGPDNAVHGIAPSVLNYWQSYVGNVIGTAGAMKGWTYMSAAQGANAIWNPGYTGTDDNAQDLEVWTQQATASACVSPTGDRCPLIRLSNYDYLTNSLADTSNPTVPNSFYLSSKPAFFSGGSGYTWPWVNAQGSTKVQSGPSTSACTTNVGGPCSGLPAKARMDNGTPFTQP